MINSKFTVGVTSHLDLSILGQSNSPYLEVQWTWLELFTFFFFFLRYMLFMCALTPQGRQSNYSLEFMSHFQWRTSGRQREMVVNNRSQLFDIYSRRLVKSKPQPCSTYGVTPMFLIFRINMLLPSRILSGCFPCLHLNRAEYEA